LCEIYINDRYYRMVTKDSYDVKLIWYSQRKKRTEYRKLCVIYLVTESVYKTTLSNASVSRWLRRQFVYKLFQRFNISTISLRKVSN
jgi:hypothetical protein